MELQEAVKIRIEKLCAERNLSINKLAKLSKLKQSTVQHLADGSSKNPKMETIVSICIGLNISIGEFFNDKVFENIKY